MSNISARIRIKLVSPVDVNASMYLQRTIRGSGADYWDIELTTRTSEGQVEVHCFTHPIKEEAIKGAYNKLEQIRVSSWYPHFEAEQYIKWEHLLSTSNAIDHFQAGLHKVRHGDYTRKQFIELWEYRDRLATGHAEHATWPRTMQEELCISKDRLDALKKEQATPPRKWKWYNWFWNPQDK